jgi:hypothetical protein
MSEATDIIDPKVKAFLDTLFPFAEHYLAVVHHNTFQSVPVENNGDLAGFNEVDLWEIRGNHPVSACGYDDKTNTVVYRVKA